MTQIKRHTKVAVVMGGPSGEHEISLRSGQGVIGALTARGWSAEPLVVPRSPSLEEALAFTRSALQRMGADVVFIALHGAFGEDGTIQQLCEDLQVAYTGSDPSASRLGMNKAASRRAFEAAGLVVPKWQLLEGGRSDVPDIDGALPLVVKPVSEGSSLGVSVVRAPGALAGAIAEARRYGDAVLVEAFIQGREVTVGVLGDEALPVVEIRPRHPFFDFAAKYTAGETEYLVPAPLSAGVTRAVQAAGLAAHQALGCRHLSRTDIMLTPQNVPVVLEVNTIPGFTPTSLLPKAAACRNLSYDEVCERLVLMAWHSRPHLVNS
jgi:D-alanine--D-alanine ligase